MNFLRQVCLVMSSVLCAAYSLAATPTEQEERASVRAAVRGAFEAQDFDALERMSQKFRTDKSRTASGLWKLTLFHAGVRETIADKAKEGESGYSYLESRIAAWSARFPKSPTPITAASAVHLERAWSIRGNGYAATVRPEAWKPFAESVERARITLEQGKVVASVDPHWYEVMLIIAKAQGWQREQFDKLLHEAFAREPLFYQTYFAALEYLLPKWHGDPGERWTPSNAHRRRKARECMRASIGTLRRLSLKTACLLILPLDGQR